MRFQPPSYRRRLLARKTFAPMPSPRTAISPQIAPSAPTEQTPSFLQPVGLADWRLDGVGVFRLVAYRLTGCPQIGPGRYLLVRRDADGCRRILAARRARHRVGSVNLAVIRRLGARLGASEVHIERDPRTPAARGALAVLPSAHGRVLARSLVFVRLASDVSGRR
jgi:hypothetical protein